MVVDKPLKVIARENQEREREGEMDREADKNDREEKEVTSERSESMMNENEHCFREYGVLRGRG